MPMAMDTHVGSRDKGLWDLGCMAGKLARKMSERRGTQYDVEGRD